MKLFSAPAMPPSAYHAKDQNGRWVLSPLKVARAHDLIEFLAKLGVRSADAKVSHWRDFLDDDDDYDDGWDEV